MYRVETQASLDLERTSLLVSLLVSGVLVLEDTTCTSMWREGSSLPRNGGLVTSVIVST